MPHKDPVARRAYFRAYHARKWATDPAYRAAKIGALSLVKSAQAKAARERVRRAIKSGRLVRPTRCENCGIDNMPIEAAHENYTETLKVRWLCRSCHSVYDSFASKTAGTRIVAGPHNRDKTHCPQGHEYTPDNIYWQKRSGRSPSRICAMCRRDRSRRDQARRQP